MPLSLTIFLESKKTILVSPLNSHVVYVKKQFPRGVKHSVETRVINRSILFATISTKKTYQKFPVFRNHLVQSNQRYWKIFRDASIFSFPWTKKQSFTEKSNKFLQDQSKTLLNCQYWNISELNTIVFISLFRFQTSPPYIITFKT